MVTLTPVQNQGRASFSLTPVEQPPFRLTPVDEGAAETQASIPPPAMPEPPPEEGEWRTGDFLPVARNLETGELSWAIPGVIHELIDFAKLPGDVAAGRADPNDPRTIERAAGLAAETVLSGVGASPARGLSAIAGQLRARSRGGAASKGGTPSPAGQAAPTPGQTADAAIPPQIAGQIDEGMASAAREAAPSPQQAAPETAGATSRVTGSVTPDRAGNINLSRIHTPEDVKQVIRETAEQAGGFTEARRGVISHRETEEMANLLGMSPEDLTKRSRGQAFNAEEMFAARRLLVEASEDFFEKARAAKANGGPTERTAALESLTRLVAIQEQVSGATAEAGRALSQFRMMAESRQQSDAIRNLLDQSGGRLDDVLNKVTALDDPAKVAGFARQAWKARKSDQIFEIWINWLLSGPTTQAVNALSNALVAAWAVPESLAAAGISKVTRSGIPTTEALGRLFGIVEGAKDGIRAGWRAFVTEEPSDMMSKIEVRRHRAVPSRTFRGDRQRKEIAGFPVPLTGPIEIGGRQARIPSRALMAGDEFFKAIGYRQEINALAARQAFKEGRTGREFAERVAELKNHPTDELMDAARRNAQVQTFTNPLGSKGSAVQSLREKIPVVRYVVPFLRTPVNIVSFAGKRSPLAPLFKDVRDDLMGKNGAAARDQAAARVSLGSMVSAATAYMAGEGFITGHGPDDGRERALLFRSGWQPYSVKIGDTYYSYGRLEPMGMLMGVAADFQHLSEHMDQEQADEIAALIIGSVAENLVNKQWLQGPSDFIQAVQDWRRYGNSYVQGLLGTLVPTGVAQVARVQDPYLREARSALDAIRNRIPGLKEGLPLRRDVFGDPIKLGGGLGPDLISPVYQSVARDDPAVAELLRLQVFPGSLRREIQGVELTPEEYESYQVNVGRTIKMGLDKMVALPQWGSIPDAAKAELLEDMIRKARDLGRTATLMQNRDLILRIAQHRAQEQMARQAPDATSQASQQPQ